MVSFQCDGCSDVVKKPKLDSHNARCHASFTCIDCSKTFVGPKDWKPHTTCISEAEKYQKALYKGPKGRGVGGAVANGKSQNGQYGRGNGKYAGGYNGRPPFGPPRAQGTGANGTPLGTPTRMSPVTAPSPPATNTPQPASPAKTDKNGMSTPPQPKVVNGIANGVEAPNAAENGKKSKQRKAEASSGTTIVNGVTDGTEASTVVEDDKKSKKRKAELDPEITSTEKSSKKKKKKSDKMADESSAVPSTAEIADAQVAASDAVVKDKSKNKKKPAPLSNEDVNPPSTDQATTDVEVKTDKKTKKHKSSRNATMIPEEAPVPRTDGIKDVDKAAPTPPEASSAANNTKEKTKKRKSRHTDNDDTEPLNSKRTSDAETKTDKKRKNRNSSHNAVTASAAELNGAVEQPSSPSKELAIGSSDKLLNKAEKKKRKKDAGTDVIDDTNTEATDKKKRKKATDSSDDLVVEKQKAKKAAVPA